MILDTSFVIRILRDRKFFEKMRKRVDENVRITSITAYELRRGAIYLMFRRGTDYEHELISNFLSEMEVLPFTKKDSEISAEIWARLREKGYAVNDADIMISSIAIREHERLLTTDRDFELIREVSELDVDIVDDPGHQFQN